MVDVLYCKWSYDFDVEGCVEVERVWKEEVRNRNSAIFKEAEGNVRSKLIGWSLGIPSEEVSRSLVL